MQPLSCSDLICYFRLSGPVDSQAWPAARGFEPPLPLASLNRAGVLGKEKGGAPRYKRYVILNVSFFFPNYTTVKSIVEASSESL